VTRRQAASWREDVSDRLALRDDARQLRFAAEILSERGNGRSLWLRILCRVLEGAADGLDRKANAL
jgi:hypothetical protein